MIGTRAPMAGAHAPVTGALAPPPRRDAHPSGVGPTGRGPALASRLPYALHGYNQRHQKQQAQQSAGQSEDGENDASLLVPQGISDPPDARHERDKSCKKPDEG